jgi:phosphoserine phosphatase
MRRQRRLILFDMDSTFIEEEVIDLLAAKYGVGEQVAELTASAMMGNLDFKSALESRLALLAGAPGEICADVRSEIHISEGIPEIIQYFHERNWVVGVVSGGFLDVIAPILDALEVDFYQAHKLEIIANQLTGKISGQVVDRQFKGDYLKKMAAKYEIPLSQTIAVGDGANDLAMISLAGLGVAYHAKPILAQEAQITLPKGELIKVLQHLQN